MKAFYQVVQEVNNVERRLEYFSQVIFKKNVEKFPKRVIESVSQLSLGVFRHDGRDLHGIQQTWCL